jgi:hypothetical protein
MTRPFQYHAIENFPVPDRLDAVWETHIQLGLPEEEADDSAHSTVKYVGHSVYNNYLKYHVRHESPKTSWLRVGNIERHKAIFIEEFHLYLPPNLSYVFVETTTKNARELLRRIKQKKSSFHYKLREIDLLAMKAETQRIRGGWFRDLGIADVRTAAIFGDDVGESDEWERFELKGKLSSLLIEFSYADELHSVNVSASGAITLYSRYDEASALELVEKFNDIAMKFQKEVEAKSRRDSRMTE